MLCLPNASARIDLAAHLNFKMQYCDLAALLALSQPPGEGMRPNPTAQMLQLVGTLGIMGLMLYFIVIRPQQKKAKDLANLVQSLKPGDRILTTGGILGIVVSVKEKSVAIRSADTKLEILKSAVSEITEKSSSSA
jgi:preprotein translocase subunit YajC